MKDRLPRAARIGRVLAAGVAVLATSAIAAPAAHAAPTALNGLFGIDAGVCSGGSVSGSFFRMILPAGTTSGPFLSNGDSTCSDKTVTLLTAGNSGGLTSGSYQPQPAQAFDGAGNAISGSVTVPVKFYGVGFATATNQTDPQTGRGASSPQITVDGDALSGDLSAFGVTWNKQVFNQGAPKPGGGLPGKTSAVRGSIDRGTGAYVLEWTSQIVGGPFNNFTGLWHLAGTYKGQGLSGGPRNAAPATKAAPGAPTSAAPTTAAPNAAAPAAPAQQAGNGASPADPNLAAVRAVKVSDNDSQPRWLLPVLVVASAIAAALLTNADRLVRRKSGGDQ